MVNAPLIQGRNDYYKLVKMWVKSSERNRKFRRAQQTGLRRLGSRRARKAARRPIGGRDTARSGGEPIGRPLSLLALHSRAPLGLFLWICFEKERGDQGMTRWPKEQAFQRYQDGRRRRRERRNTPPRTPPFFCDFGPTFRRAR